MTPILWFLIGVVLGGFVGFLYGAARYTKEEELEEGMFIQGEPGESLEGRHRDDEWTGKCPDPRRKK